MVILNMEAISLVVFEKNNGQMYRLVKFMDEFCLAETA